MIDSQKPSALVERRVVILQHRLLHYRIRFFELVRQRCAEIGIRVDLVVGQPSPRERAKRDDGKLPWATTVRNRFLVLPSRDLLWQPFPSELRSADMVVIMQESRILSNYPLLLKRWAGCGQRLAFWGHGRNFQSSSPDGLRERFKKMIATRVDWWFAYTSATVQLVRDAGFPAERISCLNNSIDTAGFRADLASWTDQEIEIERTNLGLSGDSKVGLFCGSLYADKRIDLLIAAADKVRAVHPNFVVLIVGDGPSMVEVCQAAATRPWLKILGVQKGRQKALYYRISHLVLNPGAVGLHIVDAFCAGLVLVSTRDARHGPEASYINDGINGVLTANSPEAYAGAVVALLQDETQLASMRHNALEDADRYTLNKMVDEFVAGLSRALSMQKSTGALEIA